MARGDQYPVIYTSYNYPVINLENVDARVRASYRPGVSRPLQGRPLDLTHCDEIASLLVDGIPLAEIARRLELPYTTASRRVETMRRVLAKESGEGVWVDKEARTAIQVGRGWLGRG